MKFARWFITCTMFFSMHSGSTLAQSYGEADEKLNATWKMLMSVLPPGNQASLRDAQKLWINYRASNCKAQKVVNNTSLETCKAQMTITREEELAALLLKTRKEQTRSHIASDDPLVAAISNALIHLDNPTDIEGNVSSDWAGGGIKTIYNHLAVHTSYREILALYDGPIFLKGPHKETSLLTESKHDFGYYNPEFLSWFENRLMVLLNDEVFLKKTDKLVQEYLLSQAELFLKAWNYLDANPDVKKALITRYQKFLIDINKECSTGEKPPVQYYSLYSDNLDKSKLQWISKILEDQENHYAHIETAIFFWVRRSIDGTDNMFHRILIKFYNSYAPADFMNVEQEGYIAPSNLKVLSDNLFK